MVGVGWSLGGLSSISRGPTMLSRDGFVDGVDFDGSDRFFLDGQRLICINGEEYHGAIGAEYRTEIESFSKVISHGGSVNAPDWFEVKTKAGLIMEYGKVVDGNNAKSQVGGNTMVWNLSRVRDTSGNYMDFQYATGGAVGSNTTALARVLYTGNEGVQPQLFPYFSLEFIYENRPDVLRSWFLGSEVTLNQRLCRIEFKPVGAPQYKWKYDLSYGEVSGGTGRSLLRQVKKTVRAENGSEYYMPPTSFTYQGEVPFSLNPSVEVSGLGEFHDDNYTTPTFSPLDLDGDGRMELAEFYNTKYDDRYHGMLQIHRLTGSGDSPAFSPVFPSAKIISAGGSSTPDEITSPLPSPIYADFNADGRTDVFLYDSGDTKYQSKDPNTRRHYRLLMSDGTDFALKFNMIRPGLGEESTGTKIEKCIAADIDSDGLPEIIRININNSGNLTAYMMHVSESVIQSEVNSIAGAVEQSENLQDVWKSPIDDTVNIFRTVEEALLSVSIAEFENRDDADFFSMDVNGDGLSDLAVVTKDSDSGSNYFDLRVYTSYSYYDPIAQSWTVRFNTTPWLLDNFNNWNEYYKTMPVDVNGDGNMDIVHIYGSQPPGVENSHTTFRVYLSTGVGFSNPTTKSISRNTPDEPDLICSSSSTDWYWQNKYIPGDYNGDGKVDMACFMQFY